MSRPRFNSDDVATLLGCLIVCLCTALPLLLAFSAVVLVWKWILS
jgi:hypothetical protein